jgi:hypothetical protein
LVLFCSNAASTRKKLRLKIAASSAPVALTEFIRQTGLQVLFEFDAISALTTREIDGELAPEEALRLMFDGSGLTFEFINDRTVAVRPLPVAPGSGRQSPSEGRAEADR